MPMTGWPFLNRTTTGLLSMPTPPATSLVVAAGAILGALFVKAFGRGARPQCQLRRRSDIVDEATDIIAAVTAVGDSARIVLETIALQAQTLTGSEVAAAGIGGNATSPFGVWVEVGTSAEPATPIDPPRRAGLLAVLSDENRAVRVRNAREQFGDGLPLRHPTITTFLGVPIRFRGRVVGCLCLANKHDGSEFTLEDEQLAEMFAARAAGALEAARMISRSDSRPWMQAVIDQMPEGVVLVDGRGRVMLQNRALRTLVQAMPQSTNDADSPAFELCFTTGERLAPHDAPLVRAMANREVTVGRELLAPGPADRPVPLLVSAAPILRSNGSQDGAVMVCQEISTVRELQRVREEWASLVAHELRQPISVIAVKTSLLLRGQLSREQREGIEQIARSVKNLGRMVADLMDASLLESDRLRVTFERLDLGELLVDVIGRTPQASARTHTRLPADTRLVVRGDAQRLEQVFTNLLANAVKYAAPATEINVDLSVTAGQALVRVTNKGDPIPPDELPFIFNRFARASTARVRGAKGLGLGLYIAKGLVTAHHARIWAESGPDSTSFHVALPLDGPPVPLLPRPAANAATAGRAS